MRRAPQPFDEPINVTRPLLLEDYLEHLREIWTSRQLTNGPLSHALERLLSAYLEAPQISLFNNGTHGALLSPARHWTC